MIAPASRRTRPDLLAISAALTVASPAAGQVRLDRADPSITEQALPRPVPPAEIPQPVLAPPSETKIGSTLAQSRVASAIVVDGNTQLPAQAFASILAGYIGQSLSDADLTRLAGDIASVARKSGLPLASATIAPQSMTDGILHVTLDEGRIVAVRVIGAVSPLADKLLTRALVTDKPVRRETLEAAILLVGDVPGLTVKSSQYVRQDGFGILLVTVTEDRASAYVQVDNRGSSEVGPIRSTALASFRGVAQSGDEIGLIGALTPLQPGEFAFLRARYTSPVSTRGGMISLSGSYGRAKPGASLAPLHVVGNSIDAAIAYTQPLLRSRRRSLWGNVELRTLSSDQTLLGSELRDDRLTTLTGSLTGTATLGGGALRGEVAAIWGLPIAGMSHEGDARISRADGDGRFVVWNYTVDWSVDLAGPLSMVLASSGQIASRPLLATVEIGAGGPAFGRAYDYAERTGDNGVLGSAELRANLGALPAIFTRTQLYGFVDAGYVDNLRGGIGGGSLLSSGTGVRVGRGLLDGMVEVAIPLNADRFDTGTKRPRVSFRMSRAF